MVFFSWPKVYVSKVSFKRNNKQKINRCRSQRISCMNICSSGDHLIVLKCIYEKSSGDHSLCKYDIYENPSCNSIIILGYNNYFIILIVYWYQIEVDLIEFILSWCASSPLLETSSKSGMLEWIKPRFFFESILSLEKCLIIYELNKSWAIKFIRKLPSQLSNII